MSTAHIPASSRMRIGGMDLTIADSWRDALTPGQWHALAEELFSRGDIVKQGAYKTVVRTHANGRDLLVKRYSSGALARMLKIMLNGTRARQEFCAAAHILTADIPTPQPLLLAERRICGCLPQESLIAIEFVPGCRELRDIFFDPALCSAAERVQIAGLFGELTARIFKAGINQQDYALNNFLMRTQEGRHQILFIDFERVTITSPLSDRQALHLLAKLNRVGREVTDEERLSFINAFVHAGGAGDMSAESAARAVQELTVAQTKKDIARCRITSLYTHGRYERINRDGLSGLCLKEIGRAAASGLLEAALQNDDLEVTCGARVRSLRALRLQAEEAEKFWACLNALIITGLDARLPHALLTSASQGCVLIAPEELERCRAALNTDNPRTRFMRSHFPEAFDCVRRQIGE